MAKRKKILICEFSQETNSFNPQIWGLEKFRAMLYVKGLAMRIIFKLKRSPVGGMMAAISDFYRIQKKPDKNVRSFCGIALRSGSGGPVDDKVLDLFINETLFLIKSKGPFDGILFSLHGATSTPAYPDACGRILEVVRDKTGPETVIAVACDMHGNITPVMLEKADFICGYQTYPHVDLFETGFRAASLLIRKLSGETLYTVYTHVGMIVPASGYSSKSGAFKDLLELGKAAVTAGKIEDFTVFQMQPWLDVAEGASCVVVTAKEKESAQTAADSLAKELYNKRELFWPKLLQVEDIIRLAAENTTNKPVILGDAADSPNAGAPGDSVFVLEKLLSSDSTVKFLTCVADSAATKAANKVGAGKTLHIHLGGAMTPGLKPLEADFIVKAVHGNSSFRLAGPVGKGMRINLGKTAVLAIENAVILVCETPSMCGDLGFYRAFGLDPLEFQLVVIKANTSFRENYEAIAASIHMADTPGAASADIRALPYQNLPKGMYPFSICNQ